MKRTPAYQKHVDLGAKMVPYAGYEMPVQYVGVNEEHRNVRNRCGIFDVSHMGEFFVRGEGALDLLQYVTTNDVSTIKIGGIQYTCMPNGEGGIVDDLLIYRMDENEYMLVVNASNMEKDWDWINGHNTFGAEVENRSDQISLFAVQGPETILALRKLTDIDLAAMKFYTFKVAEFGGVPNAIISATGYTGSGGFEIYIPNEYAADLWDKIMLSGESVGIAPAGLAARDTLRLEMGFCLYGNDIDETTSPIEAGLGWITKFTKDFIDADRLKKQKEDGVARRLVGFEIKGRGIPRHGYRIVNEKGDEIGVVTSGTMAPSLEKAIGMGYVKAEYRTPGTEIFIEVRNKNIPAEVVKTPFYKG